VRDYSRLASTAFSRAHTAVTALVVGAGALGNEVVKNLALLGVTGVWIADRDRIERSNLTRSILYCTPDIDEQIARGTPKAAYAAGRVHEINPDVRTTAFVGEVADLGLGVFRRSDIVFSCLDNEMARLELSWACARVGKLLVDGGLGLMNYSSGQVTVFPKSDGPCYACRKGADRRRRLLQELQGREDPCWLKEDRIEAAEGVATTPLLASIVGACQVEFGLRRIQSDESETLGRAYRITLHPTPSLDVSAFERSPTCPLHDPDSLVRAVEECCEARSDEWTPRDLLQRFGEDGSYLLLDWPITCKALCRGCAHEWEPMVRRARFRRQSCPACASDDLIESDVLTTVNADSPWATRTLAALGFPRGHVYEIGSERSPDAPRRHIEITGDLVGDPVANPC
jgi:hypothetical protein